MIDFRKPVWVCVVEGELSQPLPGLPSFSGICTKQDFLYDLDEQQDVIEHNLDHERCGWFMLRRYVHEGQVRVSER